MHRVWHELAMQALFAAESLTLKQWQGMANRVYYAVFSETHSMLIEAGCIPRDQLGTWSHESLPLLVRRHLTRSLRESRARSWSRLIRQARHIRECADYRPGIVIDGSLLVRLLNEIKGMVEKPHGDH